MTTIDPSRLVAVLFDIDGTLADTDDQAVRLATRLLTPLRFITRTRDAETLARRLVMAAEGPLNTLINLADRLMLDDLARPLTEAFDRRHANSPTTPVLIPGVEEMVPKVAARYPLAIVTTRGPERTRRFLRDSHLDRYGCEISSGKTTSSPHIRSRFCTVRWVTCRN